MDQFTYELLPGFWNFWDPQNIPSDLLLPFGEFAERHGIEAAYPTMSVLSNVGVGGVKDVLTLYVYFAVGKTVTSGFLNANLFVPKGFSNNELYDRALKLLHKDVMLQSQVIAVARNAAGVKLVVQCADGSKKLVKAENLLFTPPPSLHNLAAFDLDSKEKAPLSTWTGTWSFGSVARNPSIPENHTVLYYSPAAVPENYLDTRDYSYTLSIASAGDPGTGLFKVLMATTYPISHAGAKDLISAAVKNLTTSGTFSKSTDTSIEFFDFVDHNSILWRQSPEQLRSGIVQDVYSIQGHRSTWYTGGLWGQDYSTNVWAFTDTVLPMMLAGMRRDGS